MTHSADDTDSESAYSVTEGQGKHEGRSASGLVVMVCNDLPSAQRYVSLLNQAYRNGYKAGYRHARSKG